jgi:GRAM domain
LELVIAFTEVVNIEKRSTAVLFPNGIQITTLHAKVTATRVTTNTQYVFASFVGRDGTYDLLTSIWRLSHPDSRGHEDAEESDITSLLSGSLTDEQNSLSDLDDRRSVHSKFSDDENNEAKTNGTDDLMDDKTSVQKMSGSGIGDLLPEGHEKTECDCGKDGHYDKVVCDEVIKASLPRVWGCIFGESNEFMLMFLRDNQKLQGTIRPRDPAHGRYRHGGLETWRRR